MVLKGDSCLLNGRKPFFMPDHNASIAYTPSLILRVSRLGKEIDPSFASRYYDAVAPGADFVDIDKLQAARQAGQPWTQAVAFDYSLAIGEFVEPAVFSDQLSALLMSPEEAVSEASKLMTIRQGDLIVLQHAQAPTPVHKEDIIRIENNGRELLYCKIK